VARWGPKAEEGPIIKVTSRRPDLVDLVVRPIKQKKFYRPVRLVSTKLCLKVL
jgi:hypothetical protein